ncbi:unnamed protein product [Effrenium voratum]|uniref:Uncharacterized protein n=1 Tax=Effrenium voratum TaxID=2562239 RepID=A0AA36NFS9_9DINO|nr:unnamed protein product [Effrenium voratum]
MEDFTELNDPLMPALCSLSQDCSDPRLGLLRASLQAAAAAASAKPPPDDDVIPDEFAEAHDGLNVESFGLLDLMPQQVADVQEAWSSFQQGFETVDACGEAIFDAILDSAPTLSTLFQMPRGVVAMRLQEGIHQVIMALEEPEDVKVLVDILSFKHLELEVTEIRVGLVRDAILELISHELTGNLTTLARDGFMQVLNYIGGAMIYIKSTYSMRLKVLSSSWQEANRDRGKEKKEREARKEKEKEKMMAEADMDEEEEGQEEHLKRLKKRHRRQEQNVPKTFYDMFCFNAAVMDLLADWMYEVLDSFDAIVANAGNTYRLQEECDILTLRIAKVPGEVALGDFKAVMLSSLRSLCPKEWSSVHEVSWCWLWENVERLLQEQMGKSGSFEKLLGRWLDSLDNETRDVLSLSVYSNFFVAVPAGRCG